MLWTALDILTDLGWSVVGLVVGYLLGLLSRVAVTDVVLTRRRRDLVVRLAGLVLFITVIVAGTQVYAEQRQLATQAACQARFNEEFREAVVARLRATEDERAAQRQLLLEAIGPGSSDEAMRQYLHTLAELEQARRDNPLPRRPDCGDLITDGPDPTG